MGGSRPLKEVAEERQAQQEAKDKANGWNMGGSKPTATTPVTTPKNDNPSLGILNPSGDVSDMDNEEQNTSFGETEYLQGILKKQKNKGITPFGGSFVPPTAMA